jgi:hypothetical protein
MSGDWSGADMRHFSTRSNRRIEEGRVILIEFSRFTLIFSTRFTV